MFEIAPTGAPYWLACGFTWLIGVVSGWALRDIQATRRMKAFQMPGPVRPTRPIPRPPPMRHKELGHYRSEGGGRIGVNDDPPPGPPPDPPPAPPRARHRPVTTMGVWIQKWEDAERAKEQESKHGAG